MTDDLPDDMFLVHPTEGEAGPAASTLSFSRSPTVLLNFAGNRFTRSAARFYQEEFGLGAMDWRMLVMLTREPGSSVSHAARTIGIDKAAVSRSLRRLQLSGLVLAEVRGDDDRRKVWSLTPSGTQLHARVLPGALARQRALLEGFSAQDVVTLTGFLSRMLQNLDSESEAPTP
ncbi:MarR family transcriptional regulator [Rhodobacteraceae bacterium M382]|nr:MarR family transcriptional regulator [Rhodobacteraceae bacterium M382]